MISLGAVGALDLVRDDCFLVFSGAGLVAVVGAE